LPILGADAESPAGANGSNLEVSCNMAQAFEIPTAKQTVTGHQQFPDAFEIAAPGWPDPIRWVD
jgi:hypothetical protein